MLAKKGITEIAMFNALRDLCGLKNQDVAAWLKVSNDTVRSWSCSRTPTPDRVIRKLKNLHQDQMAAFDNEASRVSMISRRLYVPDIIELELDDIDPTLSSRNRRLPCTNAHLRVMAMVIAKYPDLKFKIVLETQS